MIRRQTIPYGKICLTCLMVACGLIAAYLGFISLVSVWIGLGHIHRAGFWVPVVAGTTSFAVVLWVFIHTTKRILSHMKEKDVVNI